MKLLVVGPKKSTTRLNEVLEDLCHVVIADPAYGNVVNYLRLEGRRYNSVVFAGHKEPATVNGIEFVHDRAVLVPLASGRRLRTSTKHTNVFFLPWGIGYRTERERALVLETFKVGHIPHEILGPGFENDEGIRRLVAIADEARATAVKPELETHPTKEP